MLTKFALSTADNATVMNYLVGGGLTGAGTAAVFELLKQLRDSDPDDDAQLNERRKVTVPAQQPKLAATDNPGFVTPLGSGIGMAGGLVAGIGGFELVRRIMAARKKEQAAKELRQAQTDLRDSLMQQAGANEEIRVAADATRRELSLTEHATGIPVGLLATLILGSGALTYGLLQKSRGTPNDGIPVRDRMKPPRLEFARDLDGDGTPDVKETVDYGDFDKEASVKDWQIATRGLASDLYLMHPTSDTCMVVNACAQPNGYVKFAALVEQFGWDAAVDTARSVVGSGVDYKTAADYALTPSMETLTFSKVAAIALLAQEPLTKAAFATLVASEFADAQPIIFTAAVNEFGGNNRAVNAFVKLSAQMTRESISEMLGVTPDDQTPGSEFADILGRPGGRNPAHSLLEIINSADAGASRADALSNITDMDAGARSKSSEVAAADGATASTPTSA